MSQSVTDKKTFTNSEIIRGLMLAFVIGGGIARFEYKTDKIDDKMKVIAERQQVILEKYMISNNYELKILSTKLENTIEDQVKINKIIADYIKPEEITIKRDGREY